MVCHAASLLRRVRRFRDVLHRPDAWVCPFTRQVLFDKPTSASESHYIPLAIGDCLHYTQVMHMPFVTHDMIYVGLGCVVGFQRHGANKLNDKQNNTPASDDTNGCIQIDRLDVIKVAGRCLFKSDTGGGSLLTRYAVASRALLSLGWYKYGAMTFNCQHAFELMLGNRSFSLGAIRMVALFVPTITILYLVAAMGLFVLLFCR